jgi:hypothetical protein
MRHLLTLALLAAAAAPALAADRVMVHGVVPPAWIERNGQILPLKPESVILEGDVLHTGRGGRMEADMPDGSAVKLGAAATLGLQQARMKRVADDDVFDAALDLVKGAFRFTTHAFAKPRKRDIRIKVGVVTAGVRGTDLVIVADEEGSKITLLEGRIELSGEMMAAPVMMERPNELMAVDPVMVMRDGSMKHVTMSHDEMPTMMGEMDAMTGMAQGSGMLMMDAAMGGKPPAWDVVVMSLHDPAIAARVAADLERGGWPVEVVTAELEGATWHRIAVPGFHSKGEAVAFARRVGEEAGLPGAWLLRHSQHH